MSQKKMCRNSICTYWYTWNSLLSLVRETPLLIIIFYLPRFKTQYVDIYAVLEPLVFEFCHCTSWFRNCFLSCFLSSTSSMPTIVAGLHLHLGVDKDMYCKSYDTPCRLHAHAYFYGIDLANIPPSHKKMKVRWVELLDFWSKTLATYFEMLAVRGTLLCVKFEFRNVNNTYSSDCKWYWCLGSPNQAPERGYSPLSGVRRPLHFGFWPLFQGLYISSIFSQIFLTFIP